MEEDEEGEPPPWCRASNGRSPRLGKPSRPRWRERRARGDRRRGRILVEKGGDGKEANRERSVGSVLQNGWSREERFSRGADCRNNLFPPE